MIHHLERAEQLAERLSDDRLRVGIRIHLSYTLSSRGELRASSEAGRGALELALRLDEPELVAEARMTLAQAACFAGDAAAIAPLLEPDMAMRLGRLRHERLGMVGTRSVWALGYLASAHAALGQFKRAAEAAEQAMRIADEVARPADLAFANLVAGLVLLERGNPEQATVPLRRAHQITVDADLRLVSSWASARLGLALALSGRGAEAWEPLRQTLATSVRQSIPLTELWSRQALAVAALAEGDVEDAERQAARVLELARAAGNRLARAWALRTRAQAEASRGSPDLGRAEQLLREALSLAEALGAGPEAARCRDALGALHAPADR
jgi:tetratricopeptide (TPR) repeat protein